MKKRYVVLAFHLFEYKVLEEYLQEMAEKGWRFLKFGSAVKNRMVFEKVTPCTIQYRVDYIDGALKTKETEEIVAYRSFVEQYGYHYVAGDLMFDVYEQQDAQYPIREDTKEDQSYMRKGVLHELILPLSLVLVSMMQLSIHYKRIMVYEYSDNLSLMMFVVCFLLGISFALQCIRIIAWLLHSKTRCSLRKVKVATQCSNVLMTIMITAFLMFLNSQFAFGVLWLICILSCRLVIEHAITDHTLYRKRVMMRIGCLLLCSIVVGGAWFSAKGSVGGEQHRSIRLATGDIVALVSRESYVATQAYFTVGNQIYRINIVKDSPMRKYIMDDLLRDTDTIIEETKDGELTFVLEALEEGSSVILGEQKNYRWTMKSETMKLTTDANHKATQQEQDIMKQLLMGFQSEA